MNNKSLKNMLIYSLLEELKKLNELMGESSMNSDFSKLSCIFLYGFNSKCKVAPEIYRRYVIFMNTVSDVLAEFGISMNNNGYSYIIDAVMLIIDQNRLDIKLTDDIYPYIRDKYSLNSSAVVEHSIRNAIKSAFDRSEINTLVCRMSSYDKKPTNKEFLFTVTQDVCSRMCMEMID